LLQWTPANPGSPGKWPLKRREREGRERERERERDRDRDRERQIDRQRQTVFILEIYFKNFEEGSSGRYKESRI